MSEYTPSELDREFGLWTSQLEDFREYEENYSATPTMGTFVKTIYKLSAEILRLRERVDKLEKKKRRK